MLTILYSANVNSSINMRLPQTPRTPSTAAAHYFDDILSKVSRPTGARTPRMRRSSTSRSIGNLSAADDSRSIGQASVPDGEANREKNAADEHIANYVSDQLERVRSNESVGAYEDEFETMLDN